MSLITRDDVYQYLQQVTPSGENDDLLDTIVARAEGIIAEYLGFEWAAYDSVASTKVVTGGGTAWLTLPPHQFGSITSLVYEGNTGEITGYVEEPSGDLYVGSSGVWAWSDNYAPYGSTWGRYRYTVTAKWGQGAVPEALKEVAVELSVNLWKERDKGMYSDVIGVEGAGAVAVGYTRAFTNRQEAILRRYKRNYTRPMVA